MSQHLIGLLLASVCLLAGPVRSAHARPAGPVTLEGLLVEMTSRDAIARWPDPAYTCAQFSSYDRRASDPDDPSTWHANSDNNQFIRTEQTDGRTEHVLMDAQGPGAIVRFWSTWSVPGPRSTPEGVLRVYLDGSAEPEIVGSIADLLDGGELVKPPLGMGVSPQTHYGHRGHNLYLPIPYAGHCKVTFENTGAIPIGEPGCDILYYQINYRTYAAGTRVRTFSRKQLDGAAEAVGSALNTLRSPERIAQPEQTLRAREGALGPDRVLRLDANGAGAVREIRIKLDTPDLEQALRSTVLEISFDGEPCVWAPVGDFFGTGHRLSPYRSWYTGVDKDGTMVCRWVMPYRSSSIISLKNVREEAVSAQIEVKLSPWEWDDRSMHFHATWHELNHVVTRSEPGTIDGASDINYVTVSGKGVYAGDTLTLFNGARAWWGEGDEKVYVDGEYFPSHFGTGTEDYYGYAWGNPNRFDSPFHAQPYGKGAADYDLVVNSRYRLLDGIPFESSLRFDMELWHWARCTIDYAPTTFWYACPGARSNIEPDPDAAAVAVVKDREQIAPIYRMPGAIEGESLRYTVRTRGVVEVQTGPEDWHWSGEQQLLWKHGKPGDTLTMELPIENAGSYRVIANLTKAIDYGIVRITINGTRTTGNIDLINNGVIAREVDLGTFSLAQGVNSVEVEIIGANTEAVQDHLFGVDYFRVVPAE